MYKVILGIETSCDETAAAVLQKDETGIRVLSNIVASSSELQATFGGVIPEQAAREQLKAIIPVVETALLKAIENSGYQPSKKAESIASLLNCFIAEKVDAIAVTYGPGLIGSLLIGVETAKTLALVWGKPLIPVNHLMGHFYANFIEVPQVSRVPQVPRGEANKIGAEPRGTLGTFGTRGTPNFPCIGLLVSGGHTDLVLFTDHNKYEYLGGTRDDAAGECFDKCARLMGLPYPGGPEVSRLAEKGDASKIKLPLPMMDSGDFDFSFSGLKTAVANIIKVSEVPGVPQVPRGGEIKKARGTLDTLGTRCTFADLAAALEETIIEVLVRKTEAAVKKFGVYQVMVAGGVAANENLTARLRRLPHVSVRNPQKIFCTDNGAMIAAAGFFAKETIDPVELQANPNLGL